MQDMVEKKNEAIWTERDGKSKQGKKAGMLPEVFVKI